VPGARLIAFRMSRLVCGAFGAGVGWTPCSVAGRAAAPRFRNTP
jgi:hypothetical protein